MIHSKLTNILASRCFLWTVVHPTPFTKQQCGATFKLSMLWWLINIRISYRCILQPFWFFLAIFIIWWSNEHNAKKTTLESKILQNFILWVWWEGWGWHVNFKGASLTLEEAGSLIRCPPWSLPYHWSPFTSKDSSDNAATNEDDIDDSLTVIILIIIWWWWQPRQWQLCQ